jgi:hypothetical protein
MDVNYIVLIAVAIVMALAYGLMGFFADWMTTKGAYNWAKLAATIVYSIIVGIVSVATGVFDVTQIANFQIIFSPVWVSYAFIYTGLLYAFSKIIVPIASQFTSKTKFYAVSQKMGLRKMDPESRGFLVFDLPQQDKQPTLNCVDQAESKDPMVFQYAIQSGAWVFLIENGELTGAKHYFFRGWFGTVVCWKPIAANTLQRIRDTGKFPEYEALV